MESTQNVNTEREALCSTAWLDGWEKAKSGYVAACFKDASRTEGPFKDLLIIGMRDAFDAGFKAAIRLGKPSNVRVSHI